MADEKHWPCETRIQFWKDRWVENKARADRAESEADRLREACEDVAELLRLTARARISPSGDDITPSLATNLLEWADRLAPPDLTLVDPALSSNKEKR